MDHVQPDPVKLQDGAFEYMFRLPKRDKPLPAGPEALRCFVHEQLQALLDIVVLTQDGKPVEVDGFMWMKDAYRADEPAVQQLYRRPEH